MKIALIFGTRPEAIKLAPVVTAFRRRPAVDCRICVTGQHAQMLQQVLDVFGLRPDADLELMRPNQTLAGLTARAVEAIDRYLVAEKPALVLVQGDTTTAFCAALTAFYRRIPVGHVEAGLRTGDLYSPWPEEANRCLTARLAAIHFAPTARSRDNLLAEGIATDHVLVTGNTVIDALLMAREHARTTPPDIPNLPAGVRDGRQRLVVITGHRRENFGPGFEAICQAIVALAGHFPDVHFVYPVHLNPNVREPVNRLLGPIQGRNVHLLEPLPYLPFVALMDRATLLLTDSGGVQEEAPSLGKPVLVMRDTTERPEAVDAGTARLVGTDAAAITAAVTQLLTDPAAYRRMAQAHNPYGDGRAAERIADACTHLLVSGAVRPVGA